MTDLGVPLTPSPDNEAVAQITELYRFFAADGRLLYVGVSFNALRRLRQHYETADWVVGVVKITIERFETRETALRAEIEAIRTEHPAYNVMHAVEEDYVEEEQWIDEPVCNADANQRLLNDELWPRKTVLAFFGIATSALDQGMKRGRYPIPINIGLRNYRWFKSECEAAKQKGNDRDHARRQQEQIRSRYSIATHEAGRVVIARALGIPNSHASIIERQQLPIDQPSIDVINQWEQRGKRRGSKLVDRHRTAVHAKIIIAMPGTKL